MQNSIPRYPDSMLRVCRKVSSYILATHLLAHPVHASLYLWRLAVATSSSSFDADPASLLPISDIIEGTIVQATTAEIATDALSQQIFELATAGMLLLDVAAHRIHVMNPAFRQLWASLSCASEEYDEEQLVAWLAERGILTQAERAAAEAKTFTKLQLELANADDEGEHSCWTYDLVPFLEPTMQTSVIRRVLLCVVDSTESWRAQQRAEQATFAAQVYAEKLEAAIEQLTEALILHDQAGQLRAYNRAALDYATNRSAVEAARSRGIRLEPDWRLFWLDGTPIPEMERPSSRAMMTGGPISGAQMLMLGEDGAYTPIIVNAAPIRTEEGLIAGSVTAFQDISAVKEVERLKDEFISIASHELRQPLTVIQGQAQLLRRNLNAFANQGTGGVHNLESLRRHVAGIESQTGRLNAARRRAAPRHLAGPRSAIDAAPAATPARAGRRVGPAPD
jgi:signal transduction histidine kinase